MATIPLPEVDFMLHQGSGLGLTISRSHFSREKWK